MIGRILAKLGRAQLAARAKGAWETLALGSSLRPWALGALALTVLALGANVWLGALNQDEGWYLYAARRVMVGEVPHRDFFFTQGLVFPCFYALFGWLWSSFGVLGGRVFTAALSLAALFLADGAVVSGCRREEERWQARLVLWALLGLNLWYSYFTVIPKAYALCTLGLAGVLRLLTARQDSGALDPLCTLLGGVLCALLADVRLSMGVLILAVGAWLVLRRAWVGRCSAFWFAAGAALGLAAAFGPELIGWPRALLEAQQFHAARASMGVLGRVGALARWMRFNPVLVGLGLLIGWLRLTGRPALKAASAERGLLGELWLVCAAALGAIHLCAPVPYDDYQVPTTLPLAMAVAAAFTRLPFESMRLALAKVAPLSALLLTCAASPIAQDWVALPQDRFWVRFKAEPDLVALRRIGRELRALAAARGTRQLWTQETYLAVEAGLEVPRGLEMGPFSKPQPLDVRPPLAAWAGYTYALRFPDLAPAPDCARRRAALSQAYPKILLTCPDFGQGHTQLTIAER